MMLRTKFTCIATVLLAATWKVCMADSTDTMVQVTDTLKFYYKLVSMDGGNAVSVKMVYQGLAWLGIGVSTDGKMVGGKSVIGQPESEVSSTNPGKYDMYYTYPGGVVLMDDSAQTLINGTIAQDTTTGETTMTFTMMLDESGELSITSSGQNIFIYAMGGDNTYPLYHSGGKGSFKVDFLGSTPIVVDSEESSKNYTKIFAAHGIMAVIAWAFLTPFAVASTFLRSLFTSPLWFKVHLYFNCMSFILTAAAFVIAVLNVERNEMFSKPHFIGGWVIMGLATLQVIAGVFRPHAEKKEDPLNASHVVTQTFKSMNAGSVRALWEVTHKVFGVGLIGLTLWQMQTGIVLMTEEYGVKSFLKAYWIWIISFAAVVLLFKIFAYRKWSMNLPQKTEANETQENARD